MTKTTEKALVVLSGGQDSTTCLYWALQQFGEGHVSAVTFDYGQRHRVELDCADKIARLAGVPYIVLPINTFAAIGGNALTDSTIAPETGQRDDQTLPNTFVPGRNLIFLSFAAALAYQLGARHLITGVAQTDYSGYPDCRENTLKALELALRLGMDSEIVLHAPLMHLSKAETITLAQQVGAMTALAWSHTCYNGAVPPCGHCASCQLRAKGFADAGVPDPLVLRCQQGA
ncbi:7-cyano-7-deazaguanine synthase QueC [Neisseriaceae bacterium TC5R-5]|nr:7-cyano-7-deazaguanine synthase QueC [Neisseriaceae bacterium TC5R-5]